MVSLKGWSDVHVDDWDKEVSNSERPVVAEFWHQKCPMCQEIEPIVERLPGKLGDKAKLVRFNVLASREDRVFAINLGVRSTPTFMILCGGRPIGSIVGGRDLEQLVQEISSVLENKDSCLAATPLE